jgi:serine/threonine protein kinase
MALTTGITVAGKYLVEKEIRKETMAILYAAHDTAEDRTVWLKAIYPHLVAQGKFVERFRREAEILAQLDLPQVPKILDYGVENEIHYIVTEPVPGRPLDDRLRQLGALEVEQALNYVQQTAECLRKVNEKGIVHLDIRPANIIVTPTDSVKIINFGLARSAENKRLSATELLGTPDYISPEQAEGGEVDIRSDIYSLGVTLYELLAGETPYHGSNQVEVVMKHLSAPVPSLRHIRPDAPPEVDEIIKRCMAKKPGDRYQTPAELIADIRRLLGQPPAELPKEPAAKAPEVSETPIAREPAAPAPEIAVPKPAVMAVDYGAAPAQLRVRKGPLPGQSFPLAGEKTHIGRGPDNDIAIDNPEVSRRHACVTRGPGGYSVEDLGSTNGTFVNGVRLAGPKTLRHGDLVGLGKTVVMAFEDTATAAAGTSPAPAQWVGANRFLIVLGLGCVVAAILLTVIVAVILIATGALGQIV